ncbi:hypothetical protein MKW92_027538 [Papaver armeniacum]|nr:hypothetical protein MKW92_027538 [Papaver armeniacum]
MGRAPCCDKANVKKGPWSPEEDAKLKTYIEESGTGGNWIALPQKVGLKRCGKSCRLRWLNYLRPNIKHGGFSEEEENIICSLYVSIGSRWSIIAAQLPGRTDNDIKNYWNTRLKKKLLGKQRKEQQARRLGCLKQEMKKVMSTTGTFNMVSLSDHNRNHNQYVIPTHQNQPHIPISMPYPTQDPAGYMIDNNDPIRKLLIKLGGRFCDDQNNQLLVHNDVGMSAGNNLYCPTLNISPTQEQFYENSPINLDSSSPLSSFTNSNGGSSHLANDQYDIDGVNNLSMLQGLNCYQPVHDVDQMAYYNSQGLDSFYGVDNMGNNNGYTSAGTSSVESANWADMASLVYTPNTVITSDNYVPQGCNDHQQQGRMLKDCHDFEGDSSFLM